MRDIASEFGAIAEKYALSFMLIDLLKKVQINNICPAYPEEFVCRQLARDLAKLYCDGLSPPINELKKRIVTIGFDINNICGID